MDLKADPDKNPQSRMEALRQKLELFEMCSVPHMDSLFSDVSQGPREAEFKVKLMPRHPEAESMEMKEVMALKYPEVESMEMKEVLAPQPPEAEIKVEAMQLLVKEEYETDHMEKCERPLMEHQCSPEADPTLERLLDSDKGLVRARRAEPETMRSEGEEFDQHRVERQTLDVRSMNRDE